MKNPKVSIIMPVFNSGEFLAGAIASVCEQTFRGWELIVVDDGSTDNSREDAYGFARTDLRIRLIWKSHGGIVESLNAGIRASTAPVIARMDADDVSSQDRLEKQLEALESRRGRDVVVSCLVDAPAGTGMGEGMLHYHEWLNSLITDADIRSGFFIESPIAHPTVMFARQILEKTGIYEDHGWPEDYDLWMRMYLAGVEFVKVPEILYLWRDLPERLSRKSRIYSPAAFRSLKVHYLLKTVLKDGRPITIWGCGRAGRIWAAALISSGCEVVRFIDIDPRKIGKKIGDISVLSPEALTGKIPGGYILSCVGTRGARSEIRERLLDYGYIEVEEFLLVE